MRVPTDLQLIFNRTDLKKSLRTKNKTVVLRRCRHYIAAAENVFESLRLNHFFRAELAGGGADAYGQPFHGIRHSVITKFWAVGIPKAHATAVVGHQGGERESHTLYAKKTGLRPLLAALRLLIIDVSN